VEEHIAWTNQGIDPDASVARSPRIDPRYAQRLIVIALALLLGVTWLGVADTLRRAADWPRDAWIFGCSITLLLVALAITLLRLDRMTRQRERMTRQRELALDQERSALAEKTAQLEATLAGMSDGIMMVDATLRLLAWNDKFPDFTGVPPEILRPGASMEDILRAQTKAGEFGAVDVEQEVAHRMAVLRAGGRTGTMQRTRPNQRMLELRRNPIAGGGFVTLYADVTARHQSEERLRQAEKMAAVGRLTAGVAHDFNNLLSSIIGNAELLERDLGSNPRQAQRLALVLQSAERGSDLVQRLLAFSRKQPLNPVQVDLNDIVRGMQDLLRSTLGRSIQVEAALGEALWQALVDPVQLEHVILNLAINARDAMPDGGTLTIATTNLTGTPHGADLPAGDYVSVAVADTGTGMTEEVLRNAFEPFFTTKPEGQGSGLGLSQVYGTATQSGGGIRIDSAVGRGTTVTVILPRAAAAAEAEGGCLQGAAHAPEQQVS
jgi:signal transduction histidine kinase